MVVLVFLIIGFSIDILIMVERINFFRMYIVYLEVRGYFDLFLILLI